MKTFFRLFLLFVLCSPQLFAQCECDGAVNSQGAFRRNYESGDYDSARYYIRDLQTSTSTVCRITFLNRSCLLAIAQKKYDQADSLFQLEADLLLGVDCPKLLVDYLSNRTLYFNYLNQIDSAVAQALKSLEIEEKNGLTELQIKTCANLGALFNQMGQDDKSIRYNKLGAQIAREENDTVSLAMILNQLSNSYLFQSYMSGDSIYNDSAFMTATEALFFARQSGSIIYKLESFSNISMSYGLAEDFDKCSAYADSVILNAPALGNHYNRYRANAYVQKSDAFIGKGDFSEARRMADSAYHYAMLFNVQIAFDPLDLIYQTSIELKDYERALWAFETKTHIEDSLFTIAKNAAIAELDGKYNQEKNERSIEQLNSQKQFYILLSVIGLLIVVVGVVIWRQQSLKQKHEVLQAEQRLNRARINPHFFFNVLSSIQTYSLDKENATKLPIVLSKYARLMRQTLESTYNELVSLEEENEMITNYLALQQTRFPGKFDFNIDVETIENPQLVQVPSMIIQPFIENSIEHGFGEMESGGMLNIVYSIKGEQLIISITDNGKGSSAQSTHPGYPSRAMQIVRDRLLLLDKQTKKYSSYKVVPPTSGDGYTVVIELPLLRG
jgi:two-component sensor histidine kinase